MSRLAIIATILCWIAYAVTTIIRQFLDNGSQGFRFTMEAIGYLLVVTLLSFSALMYLVARAGALTRFAKHERVSRARLDEHFARNRSSMTVLIPSYAEEPQVIRATLLSAALQEYPSMRIVLLVDDPPHPTDPEKKARLDATLAIPESIARLLEEPRQRFEFALLEFESNLTADAPDSTDQEVETLADHFAWASRWLKEAASQEKVEDHVDQFLVEQVYLSLSSDFEQMAHALNRAVAEGELPNRQRLAQYYRRLASTFDCELTHFERKKYVSTSHEANKAMNLNAYIGLMGGSYLEEHRPQGIILAPVPEDTVGALHIPDSTFLLTLDADSILLKEYCLRLVYLMEQKENQRVAVSQTPYSSFRGAPTRIERLAGATTDLQHIQHQGMTQFGATFWVGANAVIRKTAIEDIAEVDVERGFTIKRYIQDRTVIEDTESSIDLVTHNWTLYNYPERLSYSATPPDFGALVVQRRRWANGGLIIMGKLISQIRERRRLREPNNKIELMLRFNYMASIAWASFGLIFLLAYPYDGRLLSPLVLLTALPYFLCQASDLRYNGYRRSDIFRIYGFNLILLPVNLAGVLTSMRQALTSKKIPFARTPKVKDRTVAPAIYVIVPLIIVAFSIFTLYRDVNASNWGNAAFAGLNAVLASWAIVSYIGLWNGLVDIWMSFIGFLYVEKKPKKTPQPEVKVDDSWRELLDFEPTGTLAIHDQTQVKP